MFPFVYILKALLNWFNLDTFVLNHKTQNYCVIINRLRKRKKSDN